jgi:hypothetical protein
MNENESRRLAVFFATRLLRMNSEKLADYVTSLFPLLVDPIPPASRVDVAEIEQANLVTGDMFSSTVRWWRVEAGSCEILQSPDFRAFNQLSLAGATFWPYPILSFFPALPTVLVREEFGPSVVCKWRYTLDDNVDDTAISHQEILWRSDP